MYCILGQLAFGCLRVAAVVGQIAALSILSSLLALAVLIFMIVSVIRLAKSLQQSTVLYAILMFVPCVSLIALLVISGKATTQLQQAGVKVGLLGADPNSI